jgi:VWFA-related protein
MNPLRLAVLGLLCGALIQAPAQAPAQTPASPASDAPELDASKPLASISVTRIVAPTVVNDRAGNLIDGVQPAQFHLFDNGKEQNIQVDVSFEPVSLVVCIEKSARVEAILPQIKHLGTLLPLVVGDHGEAAILAFDHRLDVVQDFTTDADKLKVAINKINAGSQSSRMIDAVDRAVYMLKKQPVNNRKIILLVSETRDQASEGKARETLIDAQLNNVLVYTVDITQFAVRLTEKPEPPRPNPIEVTANNLPMGIPSTPTTVAQAYGVQNQAQFVPLLKEIYKDAKGLFVQSPSEVFAKGTGGEEDYFVKQRGFEDVIQRISTQIRSQYLISYRPNNSEEPGFHEISVSMENPAWFAKTRPGYWIGGGKQ